ncbi:MAG: dsRBD fold-containing protein [Acidimicrobiia bacterium]
MEENMDVVLSIHLVEDEIETVAIAQLDLREDHFEASGRARRNPVDPAKPVIGEELAIARALAQLATQINDSVQDKIDRFLVHTD